MKKTILAVAILSVAGTATAANVYEADGVSVDFGGALEVQLHQGYNFFDADDKMKVRLDDGTIGARVDVELTKSLNAFAYGDIELKGGNAENDELYVGVNNNLVTAKIGRLKTVWDDSGVNKDYEAGVTSIDNLFDDLLGSQNTFNNGSYAETDGGIRIDLDTGMFYGAVAHSLEDDFGFTFTDAKLGARFGNFDVRGYYQQGETEADSNGNEVTSTSYALEAEATFGKASVGTAYTVYSDEEKIGALTEERTISNITLSADYDFDMFVLAAGTNFITGSDDLDGGNATNFYANITKNLHKNVRVYGEVGYTKGELREDTDNSMSYTAGMEVTF